MNISCHGCGRNFRVRQDKLPAQGARTRCPRCGEVLVIAAPGAETAAAAPAQEMEPHPPMAMEGELFDLPPRDLLASEDDLFAVEEPGSTNQPPEPHPVIHEDARDQFEAPPVERTGGLRGWLGRLFSRES